MNKNRYLEKLLNGEKVEWKALGEVCEIIRGVRITKKDLLDNGKYPVVSGGEGFMGFVNDFNRDANTITIAQYGKAGFVNFQTQKFWANDVCFCVNPKDDVLTKYLYYFLKNKQNYLYAISNTTAIPNSIDKNKILNLQTPIPPLHVQQKIVDILDKFCKLKTALKTERELRLKQYAYYRDKLLTFGEDVEWKSLDEIFYLKNGYTPSKSNPTYWENGTIPWFRMEDIRENGRILKTALQQVNLKGVKGGKLFPANSIMIATSATIGEHALITVPFLSNQRFTVLSLKSEYANKFNTKFIFYYCFLLDEWCKKNTSISSFASVDMAGFKKFKFPIPSLETQQKIANILDKLHTYCHSLTEGLPKEIELREKQYQYYRDLLLDFPKN